ncbi:Transferase [Corchorus olitorius]|uniref:Transferase n=1 Tax=Corchorus olitorius TaxID=93759 RepID=A0A1R3HU05_9ROSI|nr:Transferase [Corchorus olitorius]
MGDVRIICSSIVKAVNQREPTRIELTPWDLILLPFTQNQKGLIFLKPKPQATENALIIHHLKTTLSLTLHYFPPLAGRLATTQHQLDDTISYFIDCNNAGALFIHATADAYTLSDIIKPLYIPPFVHSFFPLNGLRNHQGVDNPLLGIQVTLLADAIFIGCTINHCVVDGSSFWHFFNLWSEISRCSDPQLRLPVFKRWSPHHLPIRIPKSHLEQVCTKAKKARLLHEHDDPDVQERVFHFTRENIAKLKAKANAEVGTNNISSLQALLSHIWRSVIRNTTNCDGDVETGCVIAIGTRHRFQELPGNGNYFGNAMMGGFVTMKSKELLNQGVGNAAWQINKTIATMTEESIKKFLASWTASPRLVTMDSRKNKYVLVTNNSPRFNVYGNDFGWGKPIAVRSGMENKSDGKITLYCGAKEGSIDIEACLPLQTLEAMATDQEFMDTVTV